MHLCPACDGTGLTQEGLPCPDCLGRRVVAQLPKRCPRCKGTGKDPHTRLFCPMCGQTGYVSEATPYTDEPRKISTEELRNAVDDIVRGRVNGPDAATWVHGLLGGMVANLLDLLHDATAVQLWLDELLSEPGTVIIDHLGIWHESRGTGGIIYLFPVEGM